MCIMCFFSTVDTVVTQGSCDSLWSILLAPPQALHYVHVAFRSSWVSSGRTTRLVPLRTVHQLVGQKCECIRGTGFTTTIQLRKNAAPNCSASLALSHPFKNQGFQWNRAPQRPHSMACTESQRSFSDSWPNVSAPSLFLCTKDF